jgi:hypothetical protein
VSDRRIRFAGLYAVAAAAASLVLTPLLALSFFATEGGAEELEKGTVEAWADPARELAGGLLTFASADTVYFVYLKSLILIGPALLIGALATRTLRPAGVTKPERWGWRIAIAGYTLLSVGVILAPPHDLALNVVFFAFIIPGLLLSTIGSTTLGIALLRARYRPRLTPALLAIGLPFWFFGADVIGHNSPGLLPLFFAWGITGWRLWRGDPGASVEAV